MTKELKAYIRLEAIVSAAFSFFINGMIAALIYHKADTVATNMTSILVDLLLTCWLMFILSAYFCRSSLKRTNTTGILEGGGAFLYWLGRMLRIPILYGIIPGTITAAALSAVTIPFFVLLGVSALPFGWYFALKTVFAAVLGGFVTAFTLYSGMIKQ